MCSHLCYFSSLQKKTGCEEASSAILCRYTADTLNRIQCTHFHNHKQAHLAQNQINKVLFLYIFMSCVFFLLDVIS